MDLPDSGLTKEIFGLALDVPAADQEAFLAEQCRGDSALEARVRDLIAAHRQAGRFLDPGEDSFATLVDGNEKLERFQWLLVDEQPGSEIDRYKLLEVIGEGGHGIVFRAEQQQPVHRVVALKVIRKGMESAAGRARFDAERQILALMDHPNIARLFDAGTTELGRPYFVMELVAGIPITRYCDDHRLPIRRRMELFITVCRAVHHAHQKGIIHQDLKPANILVAENDGAASPKVIDFGVSRLASPSSALTDRLQILGTPQYMSPEQVLTHDALDTRSDVYSLGAVLYELLSGLMVVDIGSRIETPADMKALLECASPTAPSERLSGLSAASTFREKLAEIGHNRTLIPAALVKLLKEDLDWIVLKAIRRDRAKRYDSAAALADDLQRYLEGRPVLAAPPGLSYVYRRFRGRNKFAVLLTIVIACVLMVSSVAVTAAYFQARAARDRAVAAEAARARSQARVISKLRESYLLQAKGQSRSRQPGQRIESLKTLALAAAIDPSIELRNEAIYCMSLPDAQLLEKWDLPRVGQLQFFTRKWDRYAVTDPTLGIHVFGMPDLKLSAEFADTVSSVGYSEFSPDGRFFADLTADRNHFHIWDLVTHQKVFSLDYWPAFRFSHDGESFAVDTPSHDIAIYSLPRVQKVKTLPAAFNLVGELHALLFSPDNQTIAVLGTLPGLGLVSVDSSIPPRKIDTGAGTVMTAAWSPDGREIVVGKDRGIDRILVFRIDTGLPVAAMNEHAGIVVDVAFSHKGRYLLSGGWDGALRVWDVATGSEQLSLDGFAETLQTGADDAQFSFGGGRDHQLWRLTTGEGYRVLLGKVEDEQILWTETSPDGSLLAATTDAGLRIWKLQTGEPYCFLSVPGARSVLFSPDGKELMASCADGLRTWDIAKLAGRQDPTTKPVDAGGTSSLAVSRDGRTAVFESPDGALTVADPDRPDDGFTLSQHLKRFRFSDVSPDGNWAVTSPRFGTSSVWNLRSRTLAHEFPISPMSNENGQARFDTTGKVLVIADPTTDRWYSVGDWKLLRTLQREPGEIGHVAFSPDGKLMALDGAGHSITLLDATTGKELAVFDTPDPQADACLCFSRNSTLLIASGGARFVKIWDLPKIRHTLEAMNLDWN